MKSKKFSKRNLDDETAKLIEEKCPAELSTDDIEDVFRKSCKKYLKADVLSGSNTNQQAETAVESVHVEVIQIKRKFAFFSLNKVCAVMCGIMALAGIYALLKMPVNDIETPKDIEKLPVITENNNAGTDSDNAVTTAKNTSTTILHTVQTTETVLQSKVNVTTVAENIVVGTNTDVTEPIKEPIAETKAEISIMTEIRSEETESQTETNVTATCETIAVPPQTTEIRSEETESQTETNVTVTCETTSLPFQTTETVTTTDRKDNPWGYFKVVDLYGSRYYNIYYERTNTEPVTMVEHTPNVDYYSLKVLTEYQNAYKAWNFYTDESDIPILFEEFNYTYFLKQTNISSEFSYIEINGRPALLAKSTNDSGYLLCWDDGCHICSIAIFDIKDYNFMLEFANNYK